MRSMATLGAALPIHSELIDPHFLPGRLGSQFLATGSHTTEVPMTMPTSQPTFRTCARTRM